MANKVKAQSEHEYDEEATFKVLKNFFEKMGWEIENWEDGFQNLTIRVDVKKMMQKHLKEMQRSVPLPLHLFDWSWVGHQNGVAELELTTEDVKSKV